MGWTEASGRESQSAAAGCSRYQETGRAELNLIQADLARSPAERAAEMPVSKLCELFLEERGKTNIRPGTERIYRYLFQWDLLPVCGIYLWAWWIGRSCRSHPEAD